MNQLTSEQKEEYLGKHLKHRLTLLRSFRYRVESKYSYAEKGDIYRCVKDSNLIAVRLLMDFLGIRGEKAGNEFKVVRNDRKKGKKYSDDVKLDQFTEKPIEIDKIPEEDQKVIAGVYVRADKELAHITTQFNEEYNQPEKLIKAASIIEQLLITYLYKPMKREIPDIDK